jgi:hypothetical protein
MAVLRTLDEIWAQGAIDALEHAPMTQAQADRVAAILAPCLARRAALETAPA